LPLPTAPSPASPHLPEPLDDVRAEQRTSQPLQQVEQRQNARVHIEAPSRWGVGDREALSLPPPCIPGESPEALLGHQEDPSLSPRALQQKTLPCTQHRPRATHWLLTGQGDALLQWGLGEHDHQRVDLQRQSRAEKDAGDTEPRAKPGTKTSRPLP
ncbi:unnamed protein product, partial [Gulo gulo]